MVMSSAVCEWPHYPVADMEGEWKGMFNSLE